MNRAVLIYIKELLGFVSKIITSVLGYGQDTLLFNLID